MNLFKVILILLGAIFTLNIVLFRPELHKIVKFENVELVASNKDVNNFTEAEKIEWNKWRSDIVNKIMQKTKITLDEEPLGTVNFVQFTVDSNRNISNIKISATPSEYTKIAQSRFFETINNLNGDAILDFPQNSYRKIITFNNAFIMGKKTQYTTPNDYSDYETIKR